MYIFNRSLQSLYCYGNSLLEDTCLGLRPGPPAGEDSGGVFELEVEMLTETGRETQQFF